MFVRQKYISMGVQVNIKGKVNKNELYREKNRGLTYISKFVTVVLLCSSRIFIQGL